MSKSLVTLLDNSIFPASVMVVSKFLGVILAIEFFNIQWSIKDYASSIFSIGTIVRPEDLATVTSYSDIIMLTALVLFFSFAVVRAVFFHSTHVRPTLLLKLATNNLLNLVRDSYEIYHNATIWLVFLLIADVLVWINVALGRTYLWIGIVGAISTIVLGVILAHDVYTEVQNIKNHPGEYKWE